MTNELSVVHLEVLVEEPSAEEALRYVLPRVLGTRAGFRIHPHQGKSDLLAKLPSRLRAYGRWIPPEFRLVVLLDADGSDCRALKVKLEGFAREAGLVTKSSAADGSRFQILNRLAIEELEAWFFGDVDALVSPSP